MKNPNSPFGFLFFPFILALLVGCIYLIHQNNPHLMAQESLYDELKLKRGSDVTLVRSERPDGKLPSEAFIPSAMPYKNRQRTSQWPESMRPSHRFEPYASSVVPGYIHGESKVLIDGDGLYMSHPENLAIFNLDGKPVWSFKAPDEHRFVKGPVAVARNVIFTATESGRIYAFEKSSGRLIWYRASQQENLRQPVVGHKNLYIFTKNQKKPEQADLLVLNPTTGETVKTIGPIDSLPTSVLALNDDESLAFFTTESNHLFSLNLANGEVSWKSESQSALKGSPAVHGDRVYVANESGILFAHDGKSGREIWELDLGTKLASPVSILTDIFMGYLIDRNGTMHAVNLRGGKREWRYNVNQSTMAQVTTLRMRGSSFAELKFEPKTRYWTLWAFCSTARLCIFEPHEGQLLHRVELKGTPVTEPFFDGEGEDLHIGLTENSGESGGKAKALKLVHFMDSKKAKALRESQKTSPLAPATDGM